jgi:hypothetical protein
MNRLGGLTPFSRFFFFLATAREALFLRPIVRAGLQFVRLTLVAVEVKDFLRVGAAHVVSFRKWRVVVKRTAVPRAIWDF